MLIFTGKSLKEWKLNRNWKKQSIIFVLVVKVKWKKDWIQAGNKKIIPEKGHINPNDKMEKMRR